MPESQELLFAYLLAGGGAMATVAAALLSYFGTRRQAELAARTSKREQILDGFNDLLQHKHQTLQTTIEEVGRLRADLDGLRRRSLVSLRRLRRNHNRCEAANKVLSERVAELERDNRRLQIRIQELERQISGGSLATAPTVE